jgi:hypothetical protein
LHYFIVHRSAFLVSASFPRVVATASITSNFAARMRPPENALLLLADGGVAFNDALVELVVAFLSGAAVFGLALIQPLLNGSVTFHARVALLRGVRRRRGVRGGKQERERAENHCEGQAGESFSHYLFLSIEMRPGVWRGGAFI